MSCMMPLQVVHGSLSTTMSLPLISLAATTLRSVLYSQLVCDGGLPVRVWRC
jgi:hypothetical protein